MKKLCPTCPFLECNRNKPTPTGYKFDEYNEADWYSQENIDGIWNVMRNKPIEFLSCHTTDPEYFGREGQPVYACVGAALLVYINIKIFEKYMDHSNPNNSYKKYVAAVGEHNAIKQNVMLEKALAFRFGKTSLLWGGMLLPNQLQLDLNEIRWPSGFGRVIKLFS